MCQRGRAAKERAAKAQAQQARQAASAAILAEIGALREDFAVCRVDRDPEEARQIADSEIARSIKAHGPKGCRDKLGRCGFLLPGRTVCSGRR